MSFHSIDNPQTSEEFCWEVKLGEGEELRQIDDTHVGVFWEDGTRATLITAGLAHDAEGVSVPTTLVVTGPNLVTLTVHHRFGNPAAGGAPFLYPITQGAGWEGGFQSVTVSMPPTEQGSPAGTPSCLVPSLQGRSLKVARRALRRAGCALGPVRGGPRRGARIVKQYRPAHTTLPAGTAVGVKLGR